MFYRRPKSATASSLHSRPDRFEDEDADLEEGSLIGMEIVVYKDRVSRLDANRSRPEAFPQSSALARWIALNWLNFLHFVVTEVELSPLGILLLLCAGNVLGASVLHSCTRTSWARIGVELVACNFFGMILVHSRPFVGMLVGVLLLAGTLRVSFVRSILVGRKSPPTRYAYSL